MLLKALRERTRPEHDSLERNPFSRALVSETISRARYIEMLRRFHGVFAPLERRFAVGPGPRALPACFVGRGRAVFLESDLRSLGVSDSEIARLPQAPHLPACAALEEALGCAYVLEGSTLGGQVISSHVSKALGLGAENGARFFAGYGRETWPKWKLFTEELETFGARRPESHDKVVQAAATTFRALAAWLEEN